MNKTTEALTLAEEALEELHYSSGTVKAVTLYKSALAAIREVLAEQEKQEPVAWRYNSNGDWIYKNRKVWDAAEPLYAAPLQPVQEPVAEVHNTDTPSNWSIIKPGLPAGTKLYAAPVRTKDLTDDEIWEILETHPADIITAIRAVITADREKNNANNNT